MITLASHLKCRKTSMKPKRRSPRSAVPPAPTALPPEANPQLAAAVQTIIDTQLEQGTPPETRQTLDRLVAAGHSPEGARQLIAHVVVREIFTVMARGAVYDEPRFLAALAKLPELP